MGTTVRAELSQRNKYWIERHRYYELKHFCFHYPIWKKAYKTLDGLSKKSDNFYLPSKTNDISDPTERCVEARSYYLRFIEMIEKTAMKASATFWHYILKGVTEGMSYDIMKAKLDIPCCKDTYYELYRRFFWLLDRARD